MTVVQHDWVSANRLSPERSGPEVYAPPDRRTIVMLVTSRLYIGKPTRLVKPMP